MSSKHSGNTLGKEEGLHPGVHQPSPSTNREIPVGSAFRAVVVSPHLDDAVFSCGGSIPRWSKEGPVLVINVFTDFSGAPRRVRVPMGEVRDREESAASALMGFSSINLGEKDCAFRSSNYLSPSRLFGGDLLPEDPLDRSGLREKLSRIFSRITWKELILPLGVGWHVDHVAVHEATVDVHGGEGTWFYEDLPYAYVPHLVDRRLAELGHIPCENSPLALKHDARRAAKVVMQWAPFAGFRFPFMNLGALWVTQRFFNGLFRRRISESSPQSWEHRCEDISSAFDLKKQGCFLYKSQIETFFSKDSDWDHHARTVPGPDGQPGCYERYWRKRAVKILPEKILDP